MGAPAGDGAFPATGEPLKVADTLHLGANALGDEEEKQGSEISHRFCLEGSNDSEDRSTTAAQNKMGHRGPSCKKTTVRLVGLHE